MTDSFMGGTAVLKNSMSIYNVIHNVTYMEIAGEACVVYSGSTLHISVGWCHEQVLILGELIDIQKQCCPTGESENRLGLIQR